MKVFDDASKVRDFFHGVFVEGASMGDGTDHNKVYDLFLFDNKCIATWGRLDDSYKFGHYVKQSKEYPAGDFSDIKYKKIKKGYSDMSHLFKDSLSAIGNATQAAASVGGSDKSNPCSSVYKAIEDDSIRDVLSFLYLNAKKVVQKNYRLSDAPVTQVMVDEAQKVIDRINSIDVTYIDSGVISNINRLLLQLYKVTPRAISKVDDVLFNGNNFSVNRLNRMLNEEQRLLDSLKAMVIKPTKGQVLTDDKNDAKHTWLEFNNLSMAPATDKDLELIRRKLGSNASRLSRAWVFTNNYQKTAVEACRRNNGLTKRNSKLLWHGTRTENVLSIMREGLKIRPSSAVITGAMFGYGIYFAPLAQKSIGYTSLAGSYWARGSASKGYLFLNEVVMGESFDVYTFNSAYSQLDFAKLRKQQPNALSLYAHAGASIRNDEIIVYKEDQVQPLYLVELA